MLQTEGGVSLQNNILPDIRSRRYSKQRVEVLAQPKQNKKEWRTSFGPKLFWGNETMMWPVSKAALRARPNKRLVQLAVAKRNFQQGTNRVNKPLFTYSCGTESQIWEVNKMALKATASENIRRLATPKKVPQAYLDDRIHTPYGCGRVSPIWQVKQSALTSPSRPRTAQLARPKEPHKDYEPNREVKSEINPRALKRAASARVEELSRPKTRSEGPFFDSRTPEDSTWKVTPAARSASASSRIVELAKFKANPEGYVPSRGVRWPVSRSAKRAIATPRNEELAKPKIRDSMDHLQFNPEAFLVSPRAMKARCTPRIEELAQPIRR